MKILHILRSEPDERVHSFIVETSENEEWEASRLFIDQVDYNELIQKIFASEQVICWW